MAPTDEQKIAELEELNNELENYFDNTIIPQLFFDKEMILRKFTPPAMKQFKLTKADLGRSIHDLKNTLRHTTIIDNIERVLATAKILEKQIQTDDMCWYQMNILPCFDKADRKLNGVILTFINITGRVRDLKEQEKVIAEYETLLDTVSHDIKNGLTGMLLSVQLLNDLELEDFKEIKFYTKKIENGIKKIKLILGDFRESESKRHKYKAEEELLNIESILEDVKFALIDEIHETNATITAEVKHSEIVFPRRELRTIIYNLVVNAIKFKSPDRSPEISIKITKKGALMIISVKDNGIGIDPSKLKDIFSKYYRIEDTLEGSGIGLYLVKTLVSNAGGKVEVESKLGKGTEFKIYFKQKIDKVLKKNAEK
ncbi:ATP-binding protein [Algoriphagus sp.]|uniref:sensor histidine kinase n=1 Tax=Algoriphagus sp. TaxID=1872435 RepID=UPI00391C5FEB